MRITIPRTLCRIERIARGSTYAAMVIPAGTNPEGMMTIKKLMKDQRLRVSRRCLL